MGETPPIWWPRSIASRREREGACAIHTDAAMGRDRSQERALHGQDRDQLAVAWPGLRLRSPAPPLPPPPVEPSLHCARSCPPCQPRVPRECWGAAPLLGGSDMPHLPPSTKCSPAQPHPLVTGKLSLWLLREGWDPVTCVQAPFAWRPWRERKFRNILHNGPKAISITCITGYCYLCSLFCFIVSYC